MILEITESDKMLAAVRRARQQCQVRMVQLSQCRVCGAEQAEFEEAVQQLHQLERQLEGNHVQTFAAQP